MEIKQEIKHVIVVAPTRATAVNINTAILMRRPPKTVLLEEKGAEIEEAISQLHLGGFGVVAGTGTGKTLAIRHLCHKVLGARLLVDLVTREHAATERTWECNVLVATTGMVLNWFKNEQVGPQDLVVFDEVHQTSEQLELVMALARRARCSRVWMSATIDPTRYREHLEARRVIECNAFDPNRRAEVSFSAAPTGEFLAEFAQEVVAESRAVAVFVPTRALAERYAREMAEVPGLHADFYHGGESADKLRPFLEGTVPRPFMIFMTSAGASSLNIVGLDTVVLEDQRYTEVVKGGMKTLVRRPLSNNDLLQMGGRVNGRAVGGKIHILSKRRFDFHALRPETPEFVLGGAPAETALACACLGVDARDLDLIGGMDHDVYHRTLERLEHRGLLQTAPGEVYLTPLGAQVEKLPVSIAWGEVLVEAHASRDHALLPVAMLAASIEELYKLHRSEWRSQDVAVRGSDHLTAYNIVASALKAFGTMRRGRGGEAEYVLRGDWYRSRDKMGEFAAWCEKGGFNRKAIVNAILAMKSVARALKVPLPTPEELPIVQVGDAVDTAFRELLARTQSFDFVRHEHNERFGTVWPTQGGFSTATQTLGVVRKWTSKKGYTRHSVEGTDIPTELLERHAMTTPEAVEGMSANAERVRIRFNKRFAGESLGDEIRELLPDEVPAPLQEQLPEAFASWFADQMAVSMY